MPQDSQSSQILQRTTAIVRGDADAFREFFAEYQPRLLRYLLVATRGDESLAKDSLQNAFLRIVRHMKPHNDEDVLWRWIVCVARSSLIDEIRSRQRRRQREQKAELSPPLMEENADLNHTALLLGALEANIPALDPAERTLIEAYYFQQEQQAVIASRLGLTVKAVESRLARIRSRLREGILNHLRHENL